MCSDPPLNSPFERSSKPCWEIMSGNLKLLIVFGIVHLCCGGWKGMRSFIKRDGSVRSRDVALVPVVPAHPRPSVALILLHYGQHLPFLHGYGSLAGACGQTDDRGGECQRERGGCDIRQRLCEAV